MTDYADVYSSKADKYERMVAREDHEHHIESALNAIRPLAGLDILDSGAGTGRLAVMLAPIAGSIQAYDVSEAMIDVAIGRLQAGGFKHWEAGVADHRSLPVLSHSVDVVTSGWSVVYTVVWYPQTWREELGKALAELQRVLRPGGTLIILETLGTGETSPNPPSDLLEYFEYLKQAGFSSTWIRTDYKFTSLEEAKDLTAFFFGEEMIKKLLSTEPAILPECTGIWWKTF